MKNPIPQGKYVPAARAGALIFTAGMTPRVDGQLLMKGPVKASEPLESYRAAVRQAAANALTAARNSLAENETLARVVNMNVFVYAEEGYEAHSKLADFASEYLVEELGEAGVVARAALGVKSLPGSAPVEIQLVAMAG